MGKKNNPYKNKPPTNKSKKKSQKIWMTEKKSGLKSTKVKAITRKENITMVEVEEDVVAEVAGVEETETITIETAEKTIIRVEEDVVEEVGVEEVEREATGSWRGR